MVFLIFISKIDDQIFIDDLFFYRLLISPISIQETSQLHKNSVFLFLKLQLDNENFWVEIDT